MVLTRRKFEETGVFGSLVSNDEKFSCFTLEHAYDVNIIEYLPKLPSGVYTCRRGTHHLDHGTHSFETFEILNVPGHSGILFHPGNINADSSGCVLLGMGQTDAGVTDSRKAFQGFMTYLNGINSFTLVVE